MAATHTAPATACCASPAHSATPDGWQLAWPQMVPPELWHGKAIWYLVILIPKEIQSVFPIPLDTMAPLPNLPNPQWIQWHPPVQTS